MKSLGLNGVLSFHSSNLISKKSKLYGHHQRLRSFKRFKDYGKAYFWYGRHFQWLLFGLTLSTSHGF